METLARDVRGRQWSPLAADNSTYAGAIELTVTLWLDLVPHPFSVRHWLQTTSDLTFREIVDELKSAYDLLALCADNRAFIYSYSAFKGHLQHGGTTIFPLKEVLTTFLKERDPEALRILIQCLLFPSRVGSVDPNLEEEAVNKWMEIDNNLSSTFDKEVTSLLQQDFAKFRLSGIRLDQLKHGNGAVADASKDIRDKYNVLGHDLLTDHFDSHLGFGLPIERCSFDRAARLATVPKSASARRTITPEPTTCQYYQQGVGAYYRRWLRGLYPRNVDFVNQERAHLLAWYGSIDGSVATIDMSSASDTISHDQMLSVLTTSDARLAYLVGRSREVRYKQQRILKHGAFGMGSNYCFPAETHVFLAHDLVACRKSGAGVREVFTYGDDQCLPSLAVDCLFELLEKAGFKTNVEKSFYNPTGRFREACGKFFYEGCDVTPIRIPRNYRGHGGGQSNWIPGSIDLANDLYVVSKKTRNTLLYYLRKYDILFNNTGYGGICSPCATNFHLRERYNDQLQRREVRALVGAPPPQVSWDETAAFYEWLRRTVDRGPGNCLDPDWVVVTSAIPDVNAPSKLQFRWCNPD
jgi:DNA-directed RNA polymerase subunit F